MRVINNSCQLPQSLFCFSLSLYNVVTCCFLSLYNVVTCRFCDEDSFTTLVKCCAHKSIICYFLNFTQLAVLLAIGKKATGRLLAFILEGRNLIASDINGEKELELW